MNRVTQLLALFSLIIHSCQAQPNYEKYIVSNEDILGLIDSSSLHRLTIGEGEAKKWKEGFKYIDKIQVSKLQYLSDGLKINGYIVKPKKEGKYPCIIFNRGGNRDFGAIGLIQSVAMMGRLAKEGYVVIASNYRGGGGSEGNDEFGGKDINDVLNLIPLAEELNEADATRIGMFGGSRGGMMTYIALSKTSRIKAAAVLAGVADKFSSIEDRPNMENLMAELIPNFEENREEELSKRSAIKWVDKFPKETPILILHGNADWRVKSEQSLRMGLELDKYRIPYKLVIFEGADHGVSEFRDEFYDNLISWFDKYLKNDGPLPNMEFHGR